MISYLTNTLYAVLLISSFSQTALSAESVSNVNKKAPLIIQSQVKGSQEQPNVIYIMPWQGVDEVIEVQGKDRTIELPHFKPINPRDFREQIRRFSAQQSTDID